VTTQLQLTNISYHIKPKVTFEKLEKTILPTPRKEGK